MAELLSSEEVIGDRTYRLQKFPAIKGSLIFNRVMKLFVPTLTEVVTSFRDLGSFNSFLSSDTKTLGPALVSFFKEFTEQEQERLLNDLFSVVHVKNDSGDWVPLPPVLNTIFQGKIMDMFKLAWSCLNFQYGDFLDALKAAVSASMKRAATEKISETSKSLKT